VRSTGCFLQALRKMSFLILFKVFPIYCHSELCPAFSGIPLSGDFGISDYRADAETSSA